MSITGEIVHSDVQALNRSVKHIARKAGVKQNNLAYMAINFALQSAAKATRPGGGIKVRKLAKKYLYRPAEKMLDTTFFWYKWVSGKGQSGFFKSDKKIRNRKDGSIKKITRGIKFWNRKKQDWDYMPIEEPGKYHPEKKRGKIPHAGLAKMGWLLSLKKLGKPVEIPSFATPAGIARMNHRSTENEAVYEAFNEVKYISKTSPQSAVIGLRKAKNRIDNYYLKKFGIEIEKEGI